MRRCARMSCPEEPVVTIALHYPDRRVVIGELRPDRDPRLLDLCARHVGSMTPPVGWVVEDARLATVSGARP